MRVEYSVCDPMGQRTRRWAGGPWVGDTWFGDPWLADPAAAGRLVQRTGGQWPTVGFSGPTGLDFDIARLISRAMHRGSRIPAPRQPATHRSGGRSRTAPAAGHAPPRRHGHAAFRPSTTHASGGRPRTRSRLNRHDHEAQPPRTACPSTSSPRGAGVRRRGCARRARTWI